VVCSVQAIWSVQLGQDANWDLLNYHYYNPYALLNSRMGLDIGPAQLQTYFNPLLDVPIFFLIQSFQPVVVGAILGALHGLNLWLIALISWSLLFQLPASRRILLTLVATIFGALGLEAVYLLGRTHNDNLVSPFALAALLLILYRGEHGPTSRDLLAAGLTLGLGVGLKLTLAIHVAGLALALLFIPRSFREQVRSLVLAGSGVVTGMVITGGYWMLVLMRQFGSPMFPFLNGVFRSPYLAPENIDTYAAVGPNQGISSVIFFPFYFFDDPALIQASGSDPRLAACQIALSLLAVVTIVGRSWRKPGQSRLWVLSAFFVGSYVAWIALFQTSRFLVVHELLAGLLIVSIAVRLIGARWLAILAMVLILGGLLVATDPGARQRRPWQDTFFDVDVPKSMEKGSMIVIAHRTPISFVIPYFPPENRWVRILGNMTPFSEGTLYESWIRREIASHQGALYALIDLRHNASLPTKRLEDFGVVLERGSCQPLTRFFYPKMRICRARHREESPIQHDNGQADPKHCEPFFTDGFETDFQESWLVEDGTGVSRQ